MLTHSIRAARHRERGQTLLLVAASLFTLVAMAALAIDLTTLYAARGQAQRAADAAALAAAKAFVDTGATTAPADTNLRTLTTTLARAYVTPVLANNEVSGITPTLVGTVTPDYTTHLGNPQVTVTVQRTNLPTFFARIFGQRLATVRATATAEAYNSSDAAGLGAGSMPPVAPTCVKPWLVPNIDYHHSGLPFVNADGSLANPGVWGGTPDGVIGEPLGGASGVLENLFLYPSVVNLATLNLGSLNGLLTQAGYLPAEVASFSGPCSSCAGAGNFDKSISCCNSAQVYACAGTGSNPLIDLVNAQLTGIVSGTACLIGASGGGVEVGRDTISFANFKSGAGPIEITAGSGNPHNGSFVNTSGQIVTVPIVDSANLASLLVGPKIVGFMQVFVTSVDSADGGITGSILNISGCGTNINTAATPVVGGGVSPVPVRLIHN
jgi:Flp pilus assembly protein TadG